MIALDIEKLGDLLQRAEHLQLVRVHFLVAFAETEIPVHVLEALEALIQYRDRTLDDSAVLETVDIARVHFLHAFAGFRTRAIAGHTFPVQRLLLWRARSYASTVVFQKVLGTPSHAGCTIRVLPVGISLPRVRRWIVPETIVVILIAAES